MPRYTNRGDYLLVEFEEPYALSNVLEAIHAVRRYCDESSLDKVLVDLLRSEGNPGIFDRFRFGLEIAHVWGASIQAAVVARASIITRLGETVAVNRGVRIMVTEDPLRALEWLGVGEHRDANVSETP